MNLKINRIIAKSIKFTDVQKLELDKNNLIIIQKSGRKKIFEINNIEISDLEKLLKIIRPNSGIESS